MFRVLYQSQESSFSSLAGETSTVTVPAWVLSTVSVMFSGGSFPGFAVSTHAFADQYSAEY